MVVVSVKMFVVLTISFLLFYFICVVHGCSFRRSGESELGGARGRVREGKDPPHRQN